MPSLTSPGEIWMVDLGYAAKVRPCTDSFDVAGALAVAFISNGPVVLMSFASSPQTAVLQEERWHVILSA